MRIHSFSIHRVKRAKGVMAGEQTDERHRSQRPTNSLPTSDGATRALGGVRRSPKGEGGSQRPCTRRDGTGLLGPALSSFRFQRQPVIEQPPASPLPHLTSQPRQGPLQRTISKRCQPVNFFTFHGQTPFAFPDVSVVRYN